MLSKSKTEIKDLIPDGTTIQLDPSIQAIDLKASQEQLGYTAQVAKNMLDAFMVSLPEVKSDLEHAYQQSNWEALRFFAHKLHGGAIYCGVPRVKEIAKRLELAIDKKYGQQQLMAFYTQLLVEMEQLTQEYEQLIKARL